MGRLTLILRYLVQSWILLLGVADRGSMGGGEGPLDTWGRSGILSRNASKLDLNRSVEQPVIFLTSGVSELKIEGPQT